MKLLRTIRLDASDTFVYERAAAPGEWAVPGGFMFWGRDPRELTGRDRQAFRAGFLGLGSFGWSTLAVVVEATAEERDGAIESLARYLMLEHGAPTIEVARRAAGEEIDFAEELAQHAEQTLVALHRGVGDDGAVSEQFRTFARADAGRATAMPCSAGAFAMVPDENGTDPDVHTNEDEIDLAALVAATSGTRS